MKCRNNKILDTWGGYWYVVRIVMDKLQPIVFRNHADENVLLEMILCDNYRAGIKYPPITISLKENSFNESLQKGCVTLPVPAFFPGTAHHTVPVSFGRAGVSGSEATAKHRSSRLTGCLW